MKQRKDGTSPYYTNRKVRTTIDNILNENSIIWSNMGTGTPLDLKSREEGESKWQELALRIKDLDETYFNVICPYGIDS
jgi:hypothetical protein|tara:strand:+ start:851 stop:1087 length:237 start_codon:yes stop_codon:yes gene_type:complete